jgi:hypothetical protein
MPGRTVEASGHSECCFVHMLIRRSSRRPGHPLHPQPNPPDKYRFSCFDDGRQGVHPGHGEAGLLAQRSGKTAPVWQWIGLADTSSGVWEPPLKPPETTARSTSNWLVMALAAHEVPAGRVRSWREVAHLHRCGGGGCIRWFPLWVVGTRLLHRRSRHRPPLDQTLEPGRGGPGAVPVPRVRVRSLPWMYGALVGACAAGE